LCFFGLLYHNSFFNILKEYPDYLLLFALPQLLLVQIGWVLSVERCQTQTPSFQSLWHSIFSGGGSKEVNPKKEQNK
jgi:hypothetical protein